MTPTSRSVEYNSRVIYNKPQFWFNDDNHLLWKLQNSLNLRQRWDRDLFVFYNCWNTCELYSAHLSSWRDVWHGYLDLTTVRQLGQDHFKGTAKGVGGQRFFLLMSIVLSAPPTYDPHSISIDPVFISFFHVSYTAIPKWVACYIEIQRSASVLLSMAMPDLSSWGCGEWTCLKMSQRDKLFFTKVTVNNSEFESLPVSLFRISA